MRALLLLIAGAVALARPAPAEACGCSMPERCRELFQGTTFVGEVISAVSRDEYSGTATFAVREVLFAPRPVGPTLAVNGVAGAFVPGKRYVVYAHSTPLGMYASTDCSNTHEVENLETDPDIRFARAARQQRTGTVRGRVRLDDGYRAGVAVRVAGTRRTALTDERGAFAFALAPGAYQLELVDPRLTTTDPFPALTIPAGGACVVADADAQWRGRITGRVVDGRGQPVADAAVALERLDGSAPEIDAVRTDATGRYALAPLPPGGYRVGVSIARYSYDANLPFPPTYAPSTGDARRAAPITVGLAQTVTDVDIVVAPPRRLATIRGRVTTTGSGNYPSLSLETAAGEVITPVKLRSDGRYTVRVAATAEQYLRLCDDNNACLDPVRVPAFDATIDLRLLPARPLAWLR